MLASFYINLGKKRSKRGLNTKTKCTSHFAYELRDLNFRFDRTWLNRHESTTLILSLLWRWYFIFSMNIFLEVWFCSLVMLLTWCNANAKREIKHGCILYDKHMHCKKNLSCQVWTLVKLLHDEPFFMPWAKPRPPTHAKPMFITLLTRLDKLLA